MTRPIDRSPHGALKLPDARTAKGPWYTVDKEYGQITKRNQCPAIWWFKPSYSHVKVGYTFSNYYHALAYSLKLKAMSNGRPME
jgi:hypothetical protein